MQQICTAASRCLRCVPAASAAATTLQPKTVDARTSDEAAFVAAVRTYDWELAARLATGMPQWQSDLAASQKRVARMRALTRQRDFPRARSLAITFDELRTIQAAAKASTLSTSNGGAGVGSANHRRGSRPPLNFTADPDTPRANPGRPASDFSVNVEGPTAKAAAAATVIIQEPDKESEELVQQWHRDHQKPALLAGITAAKRAAKKLRKKAQRLTSTPSPQEARV